MCGRSPQALANFCGFHIKNTLILALFFVEKEHAENVVTIDNTKVFSHFMFKSRGLAKISERRLRPLLA